MFPRQEISLPDPKKRFPVRKSGSDSVSICQCVRENIPLLARGGVDATSIKMLRSILLRSGRGGQTGRTKYCAELTTITASRYRARASRPSARKKVASRLLD